MKRSIVVAAILLTALTGCGSPTASRDGDLLAVVQAHYDQAGICARLGLELPVDVPVEGPDRNRAALEALTDAGLLSASTFNRAGSRLGQAGRILPHRRYAVTRAGFVAIRSAPDRFPGGTQICFARRRIVSISSVSDMGETAGIALARVTYRWTLADIAP